MTTAQRTALPTAYVPAPEHLLNASGRPLQAVRDWAAARGVIGTEGGWLRRVSDGRPIVQGWANYVARQHRAMVADPAVVEAARKQRIRLLRLRIGERTIACETAERKIEALPAYMRDRARRESGPLNHRARLQAELDALEAGR
jgi:hypothetical protein